VVTANVEEVRFLVVIAVRLMAIKGGCLIVMTARLYSRGKTSLVCFLESRSRGDSERPARYVEVWWSVVLLEACSQHSCRRQTWAFFAGKKLCRISLAYHASSRKVENEAATHSV